MRRISPTPSLPPPSIRSGNVIAISYATSRRLMPVRVPIPAYPDFSSDAEPSSSDWNSANQISFKSQPPKNADTDRKKGTPCPGLGKNIEFTWDDIRLINKGRTILVSVSRSLLANGIKDGEIWQRRLDKHFKKCGGENKVVNIVYVLYIENCR